MAKTIEIDDDAFSCLEHARGKGESWSQLIMRCVTPKRSIEDLLHVISEMDISEETLAAIDESVERRRSSPPSKRGD